MAALVELFGASLSKKTDGAVGSIATADIKQKVVGIYFSAHWCPPCRNFTPKLVDFYTKFISSKPDDLEIVFVSSDRTDEDFDGYYAEMPWLALPFAERDTKNKLSKQFGVRGIPTLVFLDAATGGLITSSGREKVMKDPEGKDFPWPPPTLDALMTGKLLSKTGEVDFKAALEGKVRGLYFSAHWCGPCRGFTPKLIETYKKLKEAGKPFEVVFVSSDNDEDEFENYYKDMPWLAIPKDQEATIDGLNEHFEIEGIPSFIILDENNQLITSRGRESVGVDPEGKDFPWYPKSLDELTDVTASQLNDTATLIVLSGGGADEAEKVREMLQPLADAYAAEVKASSGKLPKLSFMYEGPNTKELLENLKEFVMYSDIKAPALMVIDVSEQKKYRKDSASKEDIEQVIAAYKEGTLELKDLRD